MSRQRKFLWLDDEPNRAKMANNLEISLEVNVEFINLYHTVLWNKLNELREVDSPDLVIIDHILDKLSEQEGTVEKGSTVAAILREIWPWCPLIGVTAEDKEQAVDSWQRRGYDEMHAYPEFGDIIRDLPIIADGFYEIKDKNIQNSKQLIELLCPPEDDVERITKVLPNDLHLNFKDATVARRFYAWLRDLIFSRPGFLYDRLWAATSIGLSEKGFMKVMNIFESTRYKGVFSYQSTERQRWWATSLRSLTSEMTDNSGYSLSQKLGEKLNSITTDDLSECYVCSKRYPEIIGYIDELSNKRYPMHLRCTEPHPAFQDLPFFEQIRIMAEPSR